MTNVKRVGADKPSSRKERALATRRRMMEAAYRVFSDRGYSKTTMEAVAADAGVAVQTIYFTFHTKSELLQAAYEYAVLGPDPSPPHLTTWWRTAEDEPDLVKAVAHVVAGSVELFERAAPLVWVVHADEEARSSYEFNENLRVDGYATIVSFLALKHRLRDGLTETEARDIMLTLLGPHVFLLLTRDLGWTVQEFGGWVEGALLRELFGVDKVQFARR